MEDVLDLKSSIAVIILAAGESKRICSNKSKIFMKLGSREIIDYVLENAEKLNSSRIVVVSSEKIADDITNKIKLLKSSCSVIIQEKQLGTGDACKIGWNLIQNDLKDNKSKGVLILYGDTPLFKIETLKKIDSSDEDIILFGAKYQKGLEDYGRIIFDMNNTPIEIIEKEFIDLNFDDLFKNNLCNSGVMYLSNRIMNLLDQIQSKNGQFLLTDIVKIAKNYFKDIRISCIECDYTEIFGINSKLDLSIGESIIQNRLREKAMANGAILLDPSTVYLSYDTKIGKDSVIYPNVFLGDGVIIEEEVSVLSFSFLSNCHIMTWSKIGPFAHIKSNSVISEDCSIGNFVEVKNSTIGKNSKAKHLSYIGDSTIDTEANIGAGVIFCNYDGLNKNHSKIGKNVFIGSNSSIIAPISIDDNSIIAAGSVVNKDVPADTLVINRSKQKNILQGAERYRKIKKTSN